MTMPKRDEARNLYIYILLLMYMYIYIYIYIIKSTTDTPQTRPETNLAAACSRAGKHSTVGREAGAVPTTSPHKAI